MTQNVHYLINKYMKKHYTYLIKNTVTKKIYVGVRSCTCEITDDNYWSSSKHVLDDIKKHGIECFNKRVLKEHQTRKDAINHEISIHEDYQVHTNCRFLNKAKQKSTGFDTHGLSYNKGVPRSEEAKEKQRIKMLGRVPPNKGLAMSKKQKEMLCDVWEVQTPDGNIMVTNNMMEFCKENRLNPSAMSGVARGNRQHHKGFKCKKLSNNRKIDYAFKEWKSKGHDAKIRRGAKNGQSKKIIVNDKEYDSMIEASEKTGLSMYKLRKIGIIL